MGGAVQARASRACCVTARSESKRVRIAACYILVVDKLEGEDVGRATAKEVMQAAPRRASTNSWKI